MDRVISDPGSFSSPGWKLKVIIIILNEEILRV